MYDVTLIAFAVLMATLVSASVQDGRSREVSDAHWLVICIIGVAVMLIAVSEHVTPERIMVCIGAAMIAANILHDREWPAYREILFNAATLIMFIIPAVMAYDDPFVRDSLAIPLSYVIFLVMFFTGAIKGGADAKCLISVAILFPVYPIMFGYPLIGVPGYPVTLIMSFPLAVLLHASLFSISAMLFVIVRNLIRGDTKMPNMLIGYRMDRSDADHSHVWPMTDCHGSDAADEKIWVTPKIPFIIPITAAVIFVTFIGNIIFLI